MTAPRYRTHRGALNDLAEAVDYVTQEAPEQAPRLVALYREAGQRIRRNPLTNDIQWCAIFQGYGRLAASM